MKHRPLDTYKELTIPVLAIGGTTDIQIDADSARELSDAAAKSKLLVVQDMNHSLRLCSSGYLLQLATPPDFKKPLHEELIPAIVAFVKE